jgi:3-methylcrotonyl-CoA carboxylase alpha subunit
MSEERRKQMGEAAVNAAKAVGYVGAGTVEFIVDEDGSFYFMEMNTRLQVEHPVSEMISRQDLVEWQLNAASGNVLPMTQDDLKIHGHAMEVRIYAENPDADFLPGTGKIKFMQIPVESENVRVDTGVRMGDEVSVFYDPMIAKLVVWEKDRESAIRKLYEALQEFKIVGLTTNIAFLKKVIMHPAFRAGPVDTKFIEEYKNQLLTGLARIPSNSLALAAVFAMKKEHSLNESPATTSTWHSMPNRRFNHGFRQTLQFLQNDEPIDVTVSHGSDDSVWTVELPGGEVSTVRATLEADNVIAGQVGDHITRATVVTSDASLFIFHEDQVYELVLPEPSFTKTTLSSGSLLSPMPGRVIKVSVKEGDRVEQGDCLMIMEAMKMEHQIKATSPGIIRNVFFQVGDLVEAKKVLIEIQSPEDQ